MKNAAEILKEAEKVKAKGVDLEQHLNTIAVLRTKGYSWRDIAAFFSDQGISVEHTKISRIAKAHHIETDLSSGVPGCEEYVDALKNLNLIPDSDELKMLLCHYNQPNRTITYTKLANCVGRDSHHYANRRYGELGKKMCDELGFKPFKNSSGQTFYGSIIGINYAYANKDDHFQLVMHHELSKAIAIVYKILLEA